MSLRDATSARSYHFSMFFSLAVEAEDAALEAADPALINNLNNLRDHDVGLFGPVTEFLGRGATFTVRKTLFPDSKNVVLKSGILLETAEQDEATFMKKVADMMLELRVLTHPPLMVHPNIVKLIRVSWQADALVQYLKWPVLVVELADLGTLRDIFDKFAPFSFELKLSLVTDIMSGLAALHDCGIIHGDLKSTNILCFSDSGSFEIKAKLSDFGGALMDNPEERSCPMCTPPWTAPEYALSRTRSEQVKSDVYALGLLVWQIILDGINPFQTLPELSHFQDSDEQRDQIQRLKETPGFIYAVIQSLQKSLAGEELNKVQCCLESCLQLDPTERNLESAINALGISSIE